MREEERTLLRKGFETQQHHQLEAVFHQSQSSSSVHYDMELEQLSPSELIKTCQGSCSGINPQ